MYIHVSMIFLAESLLSATMDTGRGRNQDVQGDCPIHERRPPEGV